MIEQPTFQDEERMDLPSASAMERIVACPGSVRLKSSLPPEAFAVKDTIEDEWAASGTRIHAAFETGNTLDLDKDEVEIYKQGVQYEEQIVQKWMADKALDDCEEGPREMRVWLHDPIHFPDLLGSVKLDRHYYNKARGCVLCTDLKSGFNPNLPTSPRSWQLRFAAVALWKEEYGDWMKEARVGYCKAQQKYTVNDYCDYNEADLRYSWDSISFHIWESTQPDAPLHAGPHCNWCPCKAYCVQAGAYSMLPSVILRKVGVLRGTKEEDVAALVNTMQPTDLLKIWENSNIIGKIMDAVKARLKTMTPEDLAMLGLELGKGRKLDPIANVPEAVQFLTEQDIPYTEILVCCSLKKTQLAELVQKIKGGSKETVSAWIDTNLDPWIARCTSEAPLKKKKG
jgi:hypothetical protein